MPKKRVKFIIDATSAAADISYQTDLGLLNGSRPHTEKIRDTLDEPVKGQVKKKPRTYRLKARKDYLKVAKQLRQSRNQKRKAIKKQLQYIKRNLSHIEQLKKLSHDLGSLNKRQYKMWLVVTEVEGQKHWLAEHKEPSISDRIVSLSQPHLGCIIARKSRKTRRSWSQTLG